jgi:Protein of unknown function (DUF2851)
MSTICVREPHTSTHVYEHEVARRWYALPPGALLPLSNGDTCRLLFAGRPGSAAGPDVRDAVLRFSQDKKQRAGDVEFHVRASDWFAHRHHTDARYNSVLLHVVLICDNTFPALRQNGTSIPMCSLYDLPLLRRHQAAAIWPCHAVMQQMDGEERARLLHQAGLLRFEQKTHAFVEQLHAASPQGPFSAYDACLIPALAEGLGYGRDRAFFRAAGQRLLGLSSDVPEPLGRAFNPSPLDAGRLSVLRKLIFQWRSAGAWQTLKRAAWSPLGEIRAIFAGLSSARADILICNVVLPFAAAVALIENDGILAEQTRKLYLEHPGLSSNRVTRAMSQQLQLGAEPEGACRQQGLHYIYQQTCQEKRCAQCMVGQWKL